MPLSSLIAPIRDRSGPAAPTAAKKLFAFSLLYVFVLFAALLADNLLARLGYAS